MISNETAALENSPPNHVPSNFPFFIQGMFLLGLLCHSRTTRASIFIAMLTTTTYVFINKTIPHGDATFFAILLFRASDALLINDVSTMKRVVQTQETNDMGLWDRLKWAFSFLFSVRLVGWTNEPTHVLPPHPTASKWHFVGSRIVKLVCYAALFDAALTVTKHLPADWNYSDISLDALGRRMLYTATCATCGWLYLDSHYTVLSIIFTATGLTAASEWPELFGKWSDAYTVRRFWGRSWHQNLRRIVSVYGDLIAFRILRLKKDTVLGTNVERHVAFAVSGLIHAISDYAVLRSAFWDGNHLITMTFFVIQATVIMLEQEVGKLFNIKPGKWTRRAGLVWTFMWFTITYPPWISLVLRLLPDFGAWEVGSVTTWICTGKWNYGDRMWL